jgi:hypothetical protein
MEKIYAPTIENKTTKTESNFAQAEVNTSNLFSAEGKYFSLLCDAFMAGIIIYLYFF